MEKKERQVWEDDGIVYMNERIYISNNYEIQEQILQENHNLVNMEHSGQQRMLELIRRNYWWPGIKNDIKEYV